MKYLLTQLDKKACNGEIGFYIRFKQGTVVIRLMLLVCGFNWLFYRNKKK